MRQSNDIEVINTRQQQSGYYYFRLIYNLTHRRMFTTKVWTDDSRLLQESNLAARQPQGATSVIQEITGEGLAQGPYVADRGGVEPTTFRTKGTDNLHLTNHQLSTWFNRPGT